ncbi:MAG: proteasome accessory factor PafA2 [Nitrospirae bacterium]|nr:proteasome accessory factor PafA2 [Candidatus Manganitrophaceae bacterium]
MKKILGTETEYGIVAKSPETSDPVSNSIFLVNSYPALPASNVLWNYENENPLLDARGYEADGEREKPGPEYNRLLNKLLPNGGRLYVDGAHPEYSTPECSNALDLLMYERAGDRLIEDALEMTRSLKQGTVSLSIYKNNSDGKGNSYGYHENYLVDRKLRFDKIVDQLMPFLVTRPIFAGSGKVGYENKTDATNYQISQRADFFETLVDLNTMVKRPIINTRDEPHADRARYRRLHVIVGDTNMAEVATYLKVGTLSLVLAMLEAGVGVKGVDLDDPVKSIKAVSRDLSLKKTIPLVGGKSATAIEIQRTYLEAAARHFEKDEDCVTQDILKRWRVILDKLEEDPMQLTRELDWVIKKTLIESYMERKNCDWKDSRIALMDLQYHNLDRKKGLFFPLERGGYVETLVSPEQIMTAETNPPKDTRAYFRGTCLKKFGKEIYSASWTSVLFDVGESAMKKVPLMDPWKGSEALVGPLLKEANSVESLLKRMGRYGGEA